MDFRDFDNNDAKIGDGFLEKRYVPEFRGRLFSPKGYVPVFTGRFFRHKAMSPKIGDDFSEKRHVPEYCKLIRHMVPHYCPKY